MEKISPKISVIMSVYNGERYLREAVDSILNQTFTDFEFIVVNDGSTDNTLSILRQYSDKRLKIINHSENLGLSRSLNMAIEVAKGKYIARMDADDISLPDRLELQSACLDKNRAVGLVGCRYYQIDQYGRIEGVFKVPLDNRSLGKYLWTRHYIAHGTFMIRKEALDLVGTYDENFKYAQDYELLLRIAEKFEICNLGNILYKWRAHKGGITTTELESQRRFAVQASIRAMERKIKAVDPKMKGQLADYYSRLAFLHLKAAKDEISNSLRLSKLSPLKLLRYYVSLTSDKSYKLKRII